MTTRAWKRTLAASPGGAVEAALDLEGGRLSGEVGDASIDGLGVRRIDDRTVALETEEGWVRAFVFRRADVTYVAIGGEVIELRDAEEAGASATADQAEPFATSPMTGVVVKVAVEAGAAVPENEELVVVEAMKMEYVVRAPRDVRIDAVQTAVGDSVEFGQVLVSFKDAE